MRSGELKTYADEHGLSYSDGGELREVTPLLLGGDDAREVMQGELPGGLRGTLAHHSPQLDGERRGEFTVVVSQVPESIGIVRAFSCRSREVRVVPAYKELGHLGKWSEVPVESVEFTRSFSLEALEAQRHAWVLQLFSPAFISWLTANAPAGLCIELNEGHLCVAVPRALRGAQDLDELCAAAAHVAERLRTEVLEEVQSEAYEGDRELERELRQRVAKVRWEQPPASVQQAIAVYAGRAQWRPLSLLKSFAVALPLGAVAAAIALLLPFDLIGKAIGLVVAGTLAYGAFKITRLVVSMRAATRVGLEAFVVEFARARGLELEDRRAFHVRHRALPLPGVAQHVMSGRVDAAGGLSATLAFCADDAQMFSRGEQIAYALEDGRPMASDVLVVEVPGEGELADGVAASAARKQEGLSASQAGRMVAIWRPVPGALVRTASGVDEFLGKAGLAITKVRTSERQE